MDRTAQYSGRAVTDVTRKSGYLIDARLLAAYIGEWKPPRKI